MSLGVPLPRVEHPGSRRAISRLRRTTVQPPLPSKIKEHDLDVEAARCPGTCTIRWRSLESGAGARELFLDLCVCRARCSGCHMSVRPCLLEFQPPHSFADKTVRTIGIVFKCSTRQAAGSDGAGLLNDADVGTVTVGRCHCVLLGKCFTPVEGLEEGTLQCDRKITLFTAWYSQSRLAE